MFLEYLKKNRFIKKKKLSALDPAGMMLVQQKSSWIENAAGSQSLSVL
jgi:hypothetical protein